MKRKRRTNGSQKGRRRLGEEGDGWKDMSMAVDEQVKNRE